MPTAYDAMILTVHGKTPEIAEGVFIAPNAAVIGDARLAKDSSVWFGAVIRADHATVTVGEGSNIQDNVTVHTQPGRNLRIGKNVTVGHNAVVHCAEVGDNTLVGMGAVLLNGAIIGKNCVIGAGAVVTQDAVVPDGTMMLGVPAKVVKQLSPEAIALLEKENLYIELSKEYMK